MTLIKLSNINKTYQNGESKLHVLRDISLEISDGEFVAVMGHQVLVNLRLLTSWGCLTVSLKVITSLRMMTQQH